MFSNLLGTLVKLFLAGAAAFYAGLVLIAYKTGGHATAEIDWRNPADVAGRIAVRAGVLVSQLLMWVIRPALNILEDTSADLGNWVLHHRS